MTPLQAVDEILGIYMDAVVPTGLEIFYEDVQQDRRTTEEPWSSIFIRHAESRQSTLGGLGNRQFTRSGIVIVSLFTLVGNGLQDYLTLAKVVIDAFEGVSSPNGVWFRNVRIQEAGRDGHFYHTNVIADFYYDETK